MTEALNGKGSVLATGGTTPYVYLWSDQDAQSTSTAVGLSAGEYNVGNR